MKKQILTLLFAAMGTMAMAQNCEIQLMVAPVEQGAEVTEGFNDLLMTRLTNVLTQKGVAADPVSTSSSSRVNSLISTSRQSPARL